MLVLLKLERKSMEKEKGQKGEDAIINCGGCEEFFCLKCRSRDNRKIREMVRNGGERKAVRSKDGS